MKKRCFRVGAIAVAAGVLLGGCQAGDESGQAGDESGPMGVPIRFTEEAAERGIADIGLDGAGVAFNDYDGDGDPDIYITNNDSGTLGHEFRNRLWENDGNGYFTDVAEARGATNEGGLGRGITFGDYDLDGDDDMIVANMQSGARGGYDPPVTLYRNRLAETGVPDFEDVTADSWLIREGVYEDESNGGITATSGGVGFGDYDGDGWLDIVWRAADYEVDHALFRNDGAGEFEDTTESAGVLLLKSLKEANSQGSPGWFDFDYDGDLDLLAPNEGGPNTLFMNEGNGEFTDITRSRQPPSGWAFLNPGNANGVCLGDVDNDGDIDAYLPNADQANRLIRNDYAETGQAGFTDITFASGSGDEGGARGCTMGDYDNDGWLDIYVSNGGPSNVLINDIVVDMPSFVQFYIAFKPANNALLRNNGDGTFTDVTAGSGAEGYSIGAGVASGDVNGDGFTDIVGTARTFYNRGEMLSEPQRNFLWLNQGNDNHWIKVRLEGQRLNARIRVVSGDLVQWREIFSSTGYNSVDDPAPIFGLGARDGVDRVDVCWADGRSQTVLDPPLDQELLVSAAALEPPGASSQTSDAQTSSTACAPAMSRNGAQGVDALNSAPPTPAARMIPTEPNTLSKPITAPRSRGGAS
ncbi:MAG: CRTAC1 family protein [Chromatiales bacterium]|nr:CRTAC1 family protein [Chromatiales bacterium]